MPPTQRAQIFLDTETTGLEAERGHRIIEVVALRYAQRNVAADGEFHHFCNPQREIDADAQKVHGFSAESLADKPPFEEIAADLQLFLQDAEVIIHNAAFDCAFLDAEFKRCGLPMMNKICGKITCSLQLARQKVSGLRHYRLEDLCRHFGVDDSARTTHNALLDAKLLASVYFAMMREQMPMTMRYDVPTAAAVDVAPIIVAVASQSELAAHEQYLTDMQNETKTAPIWRQS